MKKYALRAEYRNIEETEVYLLSKVEEDNKAINSNRSLCYSQYDIEKDSWQSENKI